MDVVVRLAKPSEQDAVLAVLSLAFATDPCVRYAWPKASDFLGAYRILALALAGGGLEREGGFVAGDFDAAALWLPPGVDPDFEALAGLSDLVADDRKKSVVERVAQEQARFHPEAPHWYLGMIGVDPTRQGRGLGSALLKHTLRLCDEQRLPAYLESSNPKNVPLYERHGFDVLGVIEHDDFPPLVPMLRRPSRYAD